MRRIQTPPACGDGLTGQGGGSGDSSTFASADQKAGRPPICGTHVQQACPDLPFCSHLWQISNLSTVVPRGCQIRVLLSSFFIRIIFPPRNLTPPLPRGTVLLNRRRQIHFLKGSCFCFVGKGGCYKVVATRTKGASADYTTWGTALDAEKRLKMLYIMRGRPVTKKLSTHAGTTADLRECCRQKWLPAIPSAGNNGAVFPAMRP